MSVTPRVFIIRHGETEWSLNGRHTGTSDIPLTANGEARMRVTGKALVGEDRLIVPSKLAHVYVSPRRRAKRTLELLALGNRHALPWQQNEPGKDDEPSEDDPGHRTDAQVEVSDEVREWGYGDYEGLTPSQIKEHRKEHGQDPAWLIWRDGCPNGESPVDINARLDRIIDDIRSRFHKPVIGKPAKNAPPSDVLIVAHGHILRALAARWVGADVAENPSLILEAGGVGTLSYEHRNIEEPAILLGGSFFVDAIIDAQSS